MSVENVKKISEEELEKLIEEYDQQMDDIMNDDWDVEECEKVYKKYIKAYEQLMAMNLDKYAEKVAEAYYMFSEFYLNFTEHDVKGINVLKKRLELYKKLAERDAKYLIKVQDSYEDLADTYESIGWERKADEMYDIVDKMKESLKVKL